MKLLNEFHEGVRISFSALLANKLRSSLTTLGIVIGIVTVTLMGTAIEGLNRAFLNSISSMGADVLYVHRMSWFIDSNLEWMKQRQRQPITMAQVKLMQKEMTLARGVAPVAYSGRSVTYKNRTSTRVQIIGTTEDFQVTSPIVVKEGRFLSPSEVEGGRPLCIIGSLVASNLFINETPLGKKIRVGSHTLEVVGVLEMQGNFLGKFTMDNQLIIPIKQLGYAFRPLYDVEMQVKVLDLASLEEAKEEMRGILRKIRRVPPAAPDDFAINQQETFIRTFNRVGRVIASVGLFITGLSLFVGGIGIMNIMFVSVAERTREIGIRKALGAKRRAILLQFIIEAASICVFAGMVGVALAWPLTLLMRKALPVTLSVNVMLLAIALSFVTGIAAGFFPAWRAARMNPVDALRNE